MRMEMRVQPTVWRHPAAIAAVSALYLCFVSAVWVESDLYRYTGALLGLAATWLYFVRDREPPPIVPMAILCWIWSAYVLARFGVTLLAHPHVLGGSAEGIYLFPATLPVVGMMLYYGRCAASLTIAAFILISLVLLAATVDLHAALVEERTPFLVHNNTIHASVGGGFILIAALATSLRQAGRRTPFYARDGALLAGSIAVAVLALIGILGAQSKGVWIALAGTMPVMILLVLAYETDRVVRWLMLALLLASFAAVALFLDPIYQAVAPSLTSGMDLLDLLAGSSAPRADLEALIASGTVPANFNDRLMLWVNAFDIFAAAPLFGTGIYWENLWQSARYANAGYELVHNGFLEITMRYGLVGLGFYALLMVWSLKQAWQCMKAGLIGRYLYIFYICATVFFLLTLLTNSNNRLAIGESFLLLAGGFGFCCRFLLHRAITAQDGRA